MLQFNNPAIKYAVVGTSIALGAFSLNAQAALTSYTSNGVDLVYSSESNVTWTKDANLLGTLITYQGFHNIVNAIIAASPTINNTPNFYSPSGTYTLSDSDFNNIYSSYTYTGLNGSTTWFGAMAYVNYLNSINYAGSNKWYLPTVAHPFTGNLYTNGTANGDELVELFYQELNGTANYADCIWDFYCEFPDTGTFDNQQQVAYWTSSDNTIFPSHAWGFGSRYRFQELFDKYNYLIPWAVSPGQVAAVPEPEFGAMLLLGLGVVGGLVLRRKHQS